MRRTVGIPFQGNRGNGDHWSLGKPRFQMVVFRLSFSQPEPPAIVMDYDARVIRVFEGGRATVESFIIKLPLWRSELPDEPGKILSEFVVAGAAPVCREVIL